MDRTALDAAHAAAVRFLEGVSARPVGAAAGPEAMRAALGGPLPEYGEPAALVIEDPRSTGPMLHVMELANDAVSPSLGSKSGSS